MIPPLNWEMRDYLHELRSSGRLNLLVALLLHANGRLRCWPGTDMLIRETGLASATVTAAKKWLIERGAIRIVPFDKRVDEELKLAPAKHVYQLTGVIMTDKGLRPYVYMSPDNFQAARESIAAVIDLSVSEKSASDISASSPEVNALSEGESLKDLTPPKNGVTPSLNRVQIRSRVIETIITQGRSTNTNQLAGMIGREYEPVISDVLGELLNEGLIEPGAMGTYTAAKTDAQREAEQAFIRNQQAEEDLPPYLKTIDPALRSMLTEVEKHFGVAAWKARWMTEMLAGVAKEKQGDWHLHNVYPGLTADDVESLAKYIRQGLLKGDENMTLPQKAETLSSEAYKWISAGKPDSGGLPQSAMFWATGE